MGAMTFCGTFPYALQSMSAYPILNSSLYEGRWVEGGLSNLEYVLFPMSVLAEPTAEVVNAGTQNGGGVTSQQSPHQAQAQTQTQAQTQSQAQTHVLVSAGHQDNRGLIMRLELGGLLASLDKVGGGACAPP
jgi:hypothetical protein